MSVIDTIVNAIDPQENTSARREARAHARAAARPGDWLSLILDHHEDIEAAFAAVRSAATVGMSVTAQKHLAVLLTGHANAEEAVIYPAMRRIGGASHATTAYSQQATAKSEMSDLESLPPMSREYLDRLEHIRDAVAHHVYEEESAWFLDLKANATAQDQLVLARRYQEEFERYAGRDARNLPAESDEPAGEITMQQRVADLKALSRN
jgi:hypothetical protein